jgi:hypothetical protein
LVIVVSIAVASTLLYKACVHTNYGIVSTAKSVEDSFSYWYYENNNLTDFKNSSGC